MTSAQKKIGCWFDTKANLFSLRPTHDLLFCPVQIKKTIQIIYMTIRKLNRTTNCRRLHNAKYSPTIDVLWRVLRHPCTMTIWSCQILINCILCEVEKCVLWCKKSNESRKILLYKMHSSDIRTKCRCCPRSQSIEGTLSGTGAAGFFLVPYHELSLSLCRDNYLLPFLKTFVCSNEVHFIWPCQCLCFSRVQWLIAWCFASYQWYFNQLQNL